jgi:hypothetical protein
MMIIIMLHAIKQCFKQIHSKSKPVVNMLLLLIEVDKYNDFLIHKIFQGHKMFYVIMETNVMNIQI